MVNIVLFIQIAVHALNYTPKLPVEPKRNRYHKTNNDLSCRVTDCPPGSPGQRAHWAMAAAHLSVPRTLLSRTRS